MKIRNTLKPIITTILTVAIAITGVNPSYVTTVNAATTNATTTMDAFTDGATVTVKYGDVKKLTVTNEEGKDYTDKYKWSSSDTNIVTIEKDFISDDTYDLCLILNANSIGTVTITGKFIYRDSAYKNTYLYEDRPDVSMTIIVEQAKMTAKQKKCKHKYKTTRKATCEITGIKTCKKCKWQKIIKTTDHKWMDTPITTVAYAKTYLKLVCIGCCCETKCKIDNACPNPCKAVFTEEEYGSSKAMLNAYYEHVNNKENNCKSYDHAWGEYGSGRYEYESHEITCEYCGKEKDK